MRDKLAHLFLPRPSNNHKAKILHSGSLVIIILFFVFFQVIFQVIPTKSGQVLGYAANISTSEVERLTNVQREQNGLSDLTDDPVLDGAALKKGQDMLAKGYWAHVAPDGTQPWAFFIAAGYNYQYAGENLARDFPDASSAVAAWMASPTHRENMLSPNYKDIGIGVVEGNLAGVDTTIIVQFFGTKLGDSLPVAPLANAATPKPTINPTAKPAQTASPVPVVVQIIPSPSPTSIGKAVLGNEQTLVAGIKASPFDVTRILSMALVGGLILIVAIDGFLINRRKIFRIAGKMPAHIVFLGTILIILIIAGAGKIL